MVKFRREFDQYVNLRPVRLMPRVSSPLSRDKLRTRDLKGPASTSECGKAVAEALG